MLPSVTLDLSGNRFQVVYRLSGFGAEVGKITQEMCVEQTIEFPSELVADDDIRRHIIGQIEDITPINDTDHFVTLSFAEEVAGENFPQFFNVIFGNTSLRPNIRVEKLEISKHLASTYKGPRFGREGLRALLNIHNQPIFSTALKPIGLSAKQLAAQAGQYALGHMDIIKDDHGLANQRFAPFRERVERCIDAIEDANDKTGRRALYAPCLSAAADRMFDDAHFAKECGAGAVLIAPGLVGFNVMKALADDDAFGLPILCHPAMLGSYTATPHSGMSHYFTFGQLPRLTGADITIFTNVGGRFSFTHDQCLEIKAATDTPMHSITSSFPSPGGGMTYDNIPDIVDMYGRDVVYLIGGALHKRGPVLSDNCIELREIVAKHFQ